MKTRLILGVILLAAGVWAAAPEQVAKVMAGALKAARASWWGVDKGDSTRALRAAIQSRVPRLIVDNMGSPWITEPLACVSDQEIVFEKGAERVAREGGRGDAAGKEGVVGRRGVARHQRERVQRGGFKAAERLGLAGPVELSR